MKLTIKEMVLFSMLGSLMFAIKKLMEVLPQMHLVSVLLVAITVVYRQKALYPLYIYVFLDGLFSGFSVWWLPYLYIWTVLWGSVMLLPRQLPRRWQAPIYVGVCALHGFAFGTLYAPVHALLFNLNLEATLAWIAVGFVSADIIHGVSNAVSGLLIVPLIKLLRNAEQYTR